MSNSKTVVVTGPLAAYAGEIDEKLAALGYAQSTRQAVQAVTAALSRWLHDIGLSPAKVTDAVVEQFHDDCVAHGTACPRPVLRRLVTMLRSAGVLGEGRPVQPATKRDLMVGGYVDFLREERGLSPLSIEAYRCDVHRFLQRCKRDDVRGLTTAEVSRAVLRETFDHSPASVRRFGVALRSFLRYCYVVGIVDTDLSASALPISGRRRSLLPNGLTPEEVTRLLRACDRRRDTGRRDYAAMLLMMRLGMRASEVATLRLDDIDWRAGVLTVRGKGSRTDRLPLPVDVGEAITAYLRRGRPSTPAREVFVRSFPPRIALTRAGVTGLVLAASRRAGIGDVRAHQLRHTAACQMIRSGVPPVQIGEVLRHRSAASTAIYGGHRPAPCRGTAVADRSDVMSALADHLSDYLTMRRALGFALGRHGHDLQDFVAFLDGSGAERVTVDLAVAWVRSKEQWKPITVDFRISAVRGFAQYLHAIDPDTEIPPAGLLSVPRRRPAPHVYSPAEIDALLAAASELKPPLRAATLTTLLGLLTVTGMRLGEARALTRHDVALEDGVIVIRHAKFDRMRLVPLHATTAAALRRYALTRDLLCPEPLTDRFFLSSTGGELSGSVVDQAFRRLTAAVGLRDAGVGPRVHDLRH